VASGIFKGRVKRSEDKTLTGVGSEGTVGGKWRLSGVTSQKVVMFSHRCKS
jgi:hypothetical protein